MGDYLVAFLSTLIFIVLFKQLAVRVKLVDRPNRRKQHTGEVPLIGGVAIYCGFCLALVAADVSIVGQGAFLAASAFLLAVGVWDDLFTVSVRVRLLAQAGAALLLALAGEVALNDLGRISFNGELLALGLLAVPFTMFGATSVINAVNLIDGLDGLAGTQTLLSRLALALAALIVGEHEYAKLISLLSLAMLAFLVFNVGIRWRQQASVFLGNSGSMFLGLACVAADFSVAGGGACHPAGNGSLVYSYSAT